MDINLEWDANALAAPQSFRDGVQAAAAILDAAIYNPITVNIEVGYGEYDLNGPDYTQLSSNESLGGVETGISLTYSELRTALASNETSTIDVQSVNVLPNAASLNGQSSFFISTAQAKAFGVISPTAAGIDGYVGFPSSFTGNVLIDAAITEEAHALGLLYGDLGLFAYTSATIHYFGNANTRAYFSLDGGYTDLASYDVGFDSTLFSNQPNDPLDVPDQSATALTSLDLREIDAIGFDVTSTTAPATPSLTPTNTAAGTAPSVTVQNVMVVENKAISALSLIKAVSVATGDSIDSYAFEVAGNGNGHFLFEGTVEPVGQVFTVIDTQLNNLTYIGSSAPGSQTIFVAAHDETANSYSQFAPLTATTTQGETASDFNGDGKSDLVLANDSGPIVIETQSNLGLTGGALISNPGPTWHVVSTADMDGNGSPDLLLQNDNGAIVDYIMSGTTVLGGFSLTNPGSSWHVRGVGDFNADGKADIVLQNDSGLIVVDYTNGSSVIGGTTISNPGSAWTVEGVADFNGDGQPDLLLENTNGQIVDFLMNGATPVAGYLLATLPSGWAVAGTGNYNGDNRADIIVHNDNGSDVVLYTNGQAVTGSSAPIGNPGASYTGVVAGADYNGDGASDLLLTNTSGSLVGVTLNTNDAVISSASLGTPGVGWHAIGNNPMEFIDGTGPTLAPLTGTVGVDEFDLTSLRAAGLHSINGFDPSMDMVALSVSTFANYAAVQAAEQPYQGGTFIALPNASGVLIQGVAPDQLSSSDFVLR